MIDRDFQKYENLHWIGFFRVKLLCHLVSTSRATMKFAVKVHLLMTYKKWIARMIWQPIFTGYSCKNAFLLKMCPGMKH